VLRVAVVDMDGRLEGEPGSTEAGSDSDLASSLASVCLPCNALTVIGIAASCRPVS